MEQIRIKVDTATLEIRANAAENKIIALRRRFDRIEQIVQNSTVYWEGKGNEAHRREFREYQDDMSEALKRFQENVTDLRRIAGIYREGQETATELGQDLPGDVIL